MQQIANKKILLVTSSFPNYSETFIINKFIKLQDSNYTVKLHCDKFNKDVYKSISSFKKGKNIKKNILIGFTNDKLKGIIKGLLFILINPFLVSTLFQYVNFNANKIIPTIKIFFFDLKILRFNPDIVHFEFGTLYLQRQLYIQSCRAKVLLSFRGYDANIFPLLNSFDSPSAPSHISGIHVLSNHLKTKVLQLNHFKSTRFFKIPPAIGFNVVTRKSTNLKSQINLLTVGRLEWKKGYEYLIEACSFLKADGIDFSLTIIGGGNYFEAISFAIHQFGLNKNISILENLPHEKVLKYYSKADIFIHSSLTEGFCNAVLEAQSFGIPTICTNVGGLPENIINGYSGYLVNPYNSKAIFEKIKALVQNPDIRNKLGYNGQKRIRSKFLEKYQIQKFLAVYNHLLANG